MGLGVLLFVGIVVSLGRPAGASRVDIVDQSVAESAALELAVVNQLGGQAQAIAAEGQRAYAGIGPRLAVLEADPAAGSLELVGLSEVMTGLVQAVAVDRETVLAATARYPYIDPDDPANGLAVFDATGPGMPERISWFDADSWVAHLVADGGVAFVGGRVESEVGLVQIVDVSLSKLPRELARLETQWLDGLAIKGGYLFIAEHDEEAWPDGVVVRGFDVSDPRDPRQIFLWTSDDMMVDEFGLAVDGDRLYVMGCPVVVFDISDPANPQELPNELLCLASVTVADNRFYVPDDWQASVMVIDVTDLINFRILGGGSVDTWPGIGGLAMGNDVLFGVGLGVVAFDGREPASMPALGWWQALGSSDDVVAHRDRALVVGGGASLWTAQLSPDQTPASQRWIFDQYRWTSGIAVDRDTAFMIERGSSPADVWLADVSDPDAPRHVRTLGGLPALADVAASRGYGYVLSGRGLHVIDAREPAEAEYLHHIEVFTGQYWTRGAVATAGDLVLAGGHGLRIFDMSDPQHPFETWYRPDFEVWGIASDGRYALVLGAIADAEPSLHVLDLGDPYEPLVLSSVPTGGDSVAMAWPLAAVGVRNGVDVYTLYPLPDGAPERVASVPLAATVRNLSFDGATIHVADERGGVYALRLHVGPGVHRLFLPMVGR